MSDPHFAKSCILLLVLATATAPPTFAQGLQAGPAPAWAVTDWRNLSEGQASIDVDGFSDKVVVLYLFAPNGAVRNAPGFVTFGRLERQFARALDVAFVAIQAARDPKDSDRAAFDRSIENLDLKMPVGHADAGGPALLARYGVASTPWFVVIDGKAQIRHSSESLTLPAAIALIEELGGGQRTRAPGPRDSDTPQPAPAVPAKLEILPEDRGGQDVVGRRFPVLELDRWVRGEDDSSSDGAKATLYRWWTDSCPFCERSLPAVETLSERYGPRGLRIVGIYHPKPPRRVSNADILRRAKDIGYTGAIALDQDWSELDKVYDLFNGHRRATSVSFLVDARGIIRFCHPGPEFHPSTDPAHARCDSDYLLLEEAIAFLLK